jgi:hypothetical protein
MKLHSVCLFTKLYTNSIFNPVCCGAIFGFKADLSKNVLVEAVAQCRAKVEGPLAATVAQIKTNLRSQI